MKFAKYKSKTVRVKKCTPDKLDSLILDAKRILGIEPAKQPRGAVTSTPLPIYLNAPEVNSDTWKYANRILQIDSPAVIVWIGHPLVVSESEVIYV